MKNFVSPCPECKGTELRDIPDDCGSTANGFICTRAKNHPGAHHAAGWQCHARWEDDEPAS